MTWSISAGKTFAQCERQWFYKNCYQAWNAKKEPSKRRAYLLSKLESLSALRGKVVDDVLSTRLVSALNHSRLPDKQRTVAECLSTFDRRIHEAKQHRIDEFSSNNVKLPEDFTVLQEIHYGNGVTDEDILRSRKEIVLAIDNLFEMEELLESLRVSRYVIAQRALSYRSGMWPVKAVPDLIAFYDHEPPVVLDWKVHFFANADAAKQLASYALALVKNNAEKPHRDFPPKLNQWNWTDIRLWEAQLLVPDLRIHEYDEDQYDALQETIAIGAERMAMSLAGRVKASDFQPADFQTAIEPRRCSSCNFKELCWE